MYGAAAVPELTVDPAPPPRTAPARRAPAPVPLRVRFWGGCGSARGPSTRAGARSSATRAKDAASQATISGPVTLLFLLPGQKKLETRLYFPR